MSSCAVARANPGLCCGGRCADSGEQGRDSMPRLAARNAAAWPTLVTKRVRRRSGVGRPPAGRPEPERTLGGSTMEHIQLTATDTPRPRAAEEGDEADCPRSFLAAMIATAPIAPVAAALMTVAAYSGSAGVSPPRGGGVPLGPRLARHPLLVGGA